MAAGQNRFGLSRTVPSEVKREVRQRCGFGCVVCGGAIYDYEHFSPEYKDASVHDASGIALLCPTDHRKKQLGLLSEEDYARHIQAPTAITKGFSFTDWSTESFAPQILLGSFTFTGGTSILRIGDELLLGFTPPEEPGAPPGLIFRVFDRRGIEAFAIVDNEIRCQNEAFDVEAVGGNWRVRSAEQNIDLVLRFDPPTRVAIERLHFKYLKWELVAEFGTLELRFDGNPITTFGGGARVHGPCLFTLPENEPHVSSSNIQITFGAGPAPIGTQPTDTGFSVSWPVYCPVDPTNIQLHITDILPGYRTLGLYTRKSLAESARPDKFQLFTLSENQVRKFVKDYGDRDLIDQVAFNPAKTITTAYPWPEFLKQLEDGQQSVLQPIGDDDPLAQDHDNKSIVIQFPVYMFVKAEPETPYHEIEVAVIHSANDLLPVFTEKKYAEKATEVLDGDYRIEEFGKNGFTKFLREVILPRYIEFLTINPDIMSEEKRIIRRIGVRNVIQDLESNVSDEGMENQIGEGKNREFDSE